MRKDLNVDRIELQAREALATLMWSSTLQRVEQLQLKVLQADKNELEEASWDESSGILDDATAAEVLFKLPDNGESDAHVLAVSGSEKFGYLQELSDTAGSLPSLEAALKRVRVQLMDRGSSDGSEGMSSLSMQNEFYRELDDHLESVLKEPMPEAGEFLSIETQGEGLEACEDALERMADEWGDWYDDDYVWSGTASGSSKFAAQGITVDSPRLRNGPADTDERNEDDEMSIEEALARMDREWEGWS
jgi:hypothetical protein